MILELSTMGLALLLGLQSGLISSWRYYRRQLAQAIEIRVRMETEARRLRRENQRLLAVVTTGAIPKGSTATPWAVPAKKQKRR